ncbi:MAG: hypothetical protein LBG04_04120 [Holosporaceae bacterium]|nr:hypothetical protein [Holosporaceae bacterium]
MPDEFTASSVQQNESVDAWCASPTGAAQVGVYTNSEEICQGLKIKNREVKLVMCLRLFVSATAHTFPDGQSFFPLKPSLLGLYIINPLKMHGSTRASGCATAVVFTPKPGLFSETPPQ